MLYLHSHYSLHELFALVSARSQLGGFQDSVLMVMQILTMSAEPDYKRDPNSPKTATALYSKCHNPTKSSCSSSVLSSGGASIRSGSGKYCDAGTAAAAAVCYKDELYNT